MKIKNNFSFKKNMIKIALVFAIIFGSIYMTGCRNIETDTSEQRILDCVKRALAQGTDASLCYPENNPTGIVWIGNFHVKSTNFFTNTLEFIMKP